MSQLIFLGTGTSQGVPVIGCQCPVCLSDDPRDKRTRTSLLIEYEGQNILIDTSIDLRQQSIREGLNHLEAVLFTHTHADHLFGLDELRQFNRLGLETIPVYASEHSCTQIRRVFPYVFSPPKVHGGIPSIDLVEINGPFEVCGLPVQPVPIQHGRIEILGFRFGNVAYLTDCNGVPESSLPLLEGLDILVIDGLKHQIHATHFSIEEACDLADRLEARETYLVHMCHEVSHQQTSEELPGGVQLAWDGLRVAFE